MSLTTFLIFRILLQLRYQLRDSGWLDSTRAQMLGNVTLHLLLLASNQVESRSTTEHAYSTERASFRELLEETRTRAHGKSAIWSQNMAHVADWKNVKDVPEAVKQQILSSVRSFLDKQVE